MEGFPWTFDVYLLSYIGAYPTNDKVLSFKIWYKHYLIPLVPFLLSKYGLSHLNQSLALSNLPFLDVRLYRDCTLWSLSNRRSRNEQILLSTDYSYLWYFHEYFSWSSLSEWCKLNFKRALAIQHRFDSTSLSWWGRCLHSFCNCEQGIQAIKYIPRFYN
jgi:hypothetical protein